MFYYIFLKFLRLSPHPTADYVAAATPAAAPLPLQGGGETVITNDSGAILKIKKCDNSHRGIM